MAGAGTYMRRGRKRQSVSNISILNEVLWKVIYGKITRWKHSCRSQICHSLTIFDPPCCQIGCPLKHAGNILLVLTCASV